MELHRYGEKPQPGTATSQNPTVLRCSGLPGVGDTGGGVEVRSLERAAGCWWEQGQPRWWEPERGGRGFPIVQNKRADVRPA